LTQYFKAEPSIYNSRKAGVLKFEINSTPYTG